MRSSGCRTLRSKILDEIEAETALLQEIHSHLDPQGSTSV